MCTLFKNLRRHYTSREKKLILTEHPKFSGTVSDKDMLGHHILHNNYEREILLFPFSEDEKIELR